ncbi:hypothetical protein A2397_04255 [Candidatus Amesbacteria bacterium RIFOXYB1_FULL_44_23]|uniref:Uncharacterized protein n=1 Tax=Candidatus Amesbacteria bacterium RIFOXYB1_FULL_44_23 TaxID=1797263 RepID=A0A1F4ZUP4_9BACT|nr:MAG: hypothetical protein A2397_04255 [Candidatus Amesbacteria bacterium RIFOXYB1_FULL_44_23]
MALLPPRNLNLRTGRRESEYAPSSALTPRPDQIRFPASARTSLSGSEEKPQRTQQEPATSSEKSASRATGTKRYFTPDQEEEIADMRARQQTAEAEQKRVAAVKKGEEDWEFLGGVLKTLGSVGPNMTARANQIVDDWAQPTARGYPSQRYGTKIQEADQSWNCANGLPGVDGED